MNSWSLRIFPFLFPFSYFTLLAMCLSCSLFLSVCLSKFQAEFVPSVCTLIQRHSLSFALSGSFSNQIPVLIFACPGSEKKRKEEDTNKNSEQRTRVDEQMSDCLSPRFGSLACTKAVIDAKASPINHPHSLWPWLTCRLDHFFSFTFSLSSLLFLFTSTSLHPLLSPSLLSRSKR